MNIQAIQTQQAPGAIGPYSQAIAAPPFLFVSGQLGLVPATGAMAGDDLSSQARQAIENLLRIVEAGGSDLSHIVSVDVFLTDMTLFGEFNAIYQGFFTDHRPARAVVEVSALPKGGRVEIKCVAVMK